MRRWEEHELAPAQFWNSTPREIIATLAARNAIAIRQHNERAWLAWHIGALPRMKKYPKLDDLRVKPQASSRQSVEQQLAIARMWAARGIGTIGKVN